ncbi:hypothetical protein HOLDEFILI_00172 [Holdemania filiformis DSM 12042]|uniref:Uncharacterized protein n=1 Tax=Holdemania filiformis DSM 12042 TaxID=545696 RepID=B9Y2Z7_9FIRM|nr:hypothetical protein HOLDEFILI_00172 [Holdemania filiformis DSM 12042]
MSAAKSDFIRDFLSFLIIFSAESTKKAANHPLLFLLVLTSALTVQRSI